MIRATMISGGASQADASYFIGMIELAKSTPLRASHSIGGSSRTNTTRETPTKTLTEEPIPGELAISSKQRYGFKSGEFIVYPAHGVGQILAIEEQEIAGVRLELFVINFMKDKMTLRVPTSKFGNVGLRKLSDSSMIRQAQLALTQRSVVAQGVWSSIAQEYETKINSGDIVAIAEVVRDLYRPAINPGLSYSERQLYEAALDRLSREIAIVQHITDDEAAGEIEGLLIARAPADHPR